MMAPPMATDMQSTMDTQITNSSVGLTIDGVAARRSKAKPMSWGIAAHTSSDIFKGPVGASDKRAGTSDLTKC